MITLLDHIELNSEQKEIGTVIWLHGLGADGTDFLPVAKELRLPLRFVFPHAPVMPVTINNGYKMRAWYDIYSLGTQDHPVDQKGIDISVRALEKLIEHETQRGTPIEKIVLAGFSQGAVIALTTGLQYPKKLAGIIALSGYLPFEESIIKKFNGHIIPVFIGHGIQDEVVPFFLGQKIRDTLTTHQYPVTWHDYPMSHSVCMDEIRDIRQWLEKVYSI